MFKYMQEECSKYNIDFNLQIEGNIYHLIHNIIPKNKLETLIGDHLRDAINAVNINVYLYIIICWLVSALIASISWFLVEKPILNKVNKTK